jgi:hypothetical protein
MIQTRDQGICSTLPLTNAPSTMTAFNFDYFNHTKLTQYCCTLSDLPVDSVVIAFFVGLFNLIRTAELSDKIGQLGVFSSYLSGPHWSGCRLLAKLA